MPLVLNGYSYTPHCIKGKSSRWRCINYRRCKCRAFVRKFNGTIIHVNENHKCCVKKSQDAPEEEKVTENDRPSLGKNFQLGLIEYARVRPVIWDQSVAYSSKERDDAWIPFAVGFSIPVQIVKGHWELLLRSYCQELKNVLQHRYESEWKFFDRMDVFLRQQYEASIFRGSSSSASAVDTPPCQNPQAQPSVIRTADNKQNSTASTTANNNFQMQKATSENVCRTPSSGGSCTNQPTPVGCPDGKHPQPNLTMHLMKETGNNEGTANRRPDAASRLKMPPPPVIPARPVNSSQSYQRRPDFQSRRDQRRSRHRDRSRSNARKEAPRLTRASASLSSQSAPSSTSSIPRPPVLSAAKQSPQPQVPLRVRKPSELRPPSTTVLIVTSDSSPAAASMSKVSSSPAQSSPQTAAISTNPQPTDIEPDGFPRPIKVEADDGEFPMPIVSVKPDPDSTPMGKVTEKVQEERISSQSIMPMADSILSKWKDALTSLGQAATLKVDKSLEVETSKAELECRKQFLLSCIPDMEKMTNEQRRFFKAHLWSLVVTILDEGS